MGRLFRGLRWATCPATTPKQLLRQEGVDGDDLERINRLARGHPLSLRLAATALVAGPDLDHEATTVTAIVEELTELYLARLDPLTRQALDAASVVRRPTLSLIGRDAARRRAAGRASSGCASLPFVELSSDGLVIHDTVREVVAAYLRATDPDRSRRYRIAAWRQLRDEVTRATSHEMWRYTADLLYILENPAVREAFFPTSEHRYFVEPGAGRRLAGDPRDRGGVPSRPKSVAILEDWWRRLPDAFWAARDGAGKVVGFTVMTQIDSRPALAVRRRSAGADLARPRPATAGPARPADPRAPLPVRAIRTIPTRRSSSRR